MSNINDRKMQRKFFIYFEWCGYGKALHLYDILHKQEHIMLQPYAKII